MKDIFEVLRRKQAQQAQIAKEIELLQQAADKLREVAPLLEDGDDDSSVLGEMDEPASMAAKAGSSSSGSTAQPASKPGRVAPRWP